ncbi:MAG TPA: plastocyanin/azurin family copper-binding protein [Solirubrobacterales bacterium]|nr:plastocyanin/azurin family copper-binding protein [Solirubrobacterales bacterium]
MTAYYVLGIAMVVLAVVLSAVGLTREGFPPSQKMARAIIGGTALLVLVGAVVLITTTHKEHPRAEAAEKAAEERAKEAEAGGGGGEAGGAKAVRAVEKEFSIELEGGDTLEAGRYTFEVVNEGEIGHDLEIEGEGVEEKTPVIDGGESAELAADLKPGKYRFYCTVPGHAQSGMDTDVTVR